MYVQMQPAFDEHFHKLVCIFQIIFGDSGILKTVIELGDDIVLEKEEFLKWLQGSLSQKLQPTPQIMNGRFKLSGRRYIMPQVLKGVKIRYLEYGTTIERKLWLRQYCRRTMHVLDRHRRALIGVQLHAL